jgi:hypothetical protein
MDEHDQLAEQFERERPRLRASPPASGGLSAARVAGGAQFRWVAPSAADRAAKGACGPSAQSSWVLTAGADGSDLLLPVALRAGPLPDPPYCA